MDCSWWRARKKSIGRWFKSGSKEIFFFTLLFFPSSIYPWQRVCISACGAPLTRLLVDELGEGERTTTRGKRMGQSRSAVQPFTIAPSFRMWRLFIQGIWTTYEQVQSVQVYIYERRAFTGGRGCRDDDASRVKDIEWINTRRCDIRCTMHY